MSTVLVTLHVIVGFALILIVLLQAGGKGATMGAAFGGSNQTIFGTRGAMSFLGKLTTIAAVVFMLTSLTLAVYSSRWRSESVLQKSAPQAEETTIPAPETAPGQEATPSR